MWDFNYKVVRPYVKTGSQRLEKLCADTVTKGLVPPTILTNRSASNRLLEGEGKNDELSTAFGLTVCSV